VIRIVVAEDNYLVREGIVRLLETADDLEVIGACEDLAGLLAMVDADVPNVVLEIHDRHPEVGVVVLSQYVEPGYALALLEHGSSGRAYLLKERVSDVDQLLRAIHEVAAGGSVIDPQVVEALVEARKRPRDSAMQHLTPRECEVLGEMAQGRNNAGVASALGLSERAVEKHINSVFSKLGLSQEPDVHRRVKAVLLYLANKG
jgi:DNA-binding NarL/FixJ family response regulator